MIRGILSRIVGTQWIAPPAWLVRYARRDLEREEAKHVAELATARAASVPNPERIAKLEGLLAEVKSLQSEGLSEQRP